MLCEAAYPGRKGILCLIKEILELIFKLLILNIILRNIRILSQGNVVSFPRGNLRKYGGNLGGRVVMGYQKRKETPQLELTEWAMHLESKIWI